MELLAATILLCTILYLVDKNGAWGKFLRGMKWIVASCLALVVIGVGISYLTNFTHEASAKAQNEKQIYANYPIEVSCKQRPSCSTSPTCVIVDAANDRCREQ